MPKFMDYHEHLQLPAEAIEQITKDTKNAKADEFGVRAGLAIRRQGSDQSCVE